MSKNRIFLEDVRQAANGRWLNILQSMGVPAEYLNSQKHQPCPCCGGKDRYRFTNYQGNGGFICNQCTPSGGSGFDLLMLVFGYEFKQAVNDVAALIGLSSHTIEKHQPRIAPDANNDQSPKIDRTNKLQAILFDGVAIQEHDPVGRYLTGRGIDWASIKGVQNLYFVKSLPYWVILDNGQPVVFGHYPAMVAAILGQDDSLAGLHITYLEQSNGGAWAKVQIQHPETQEDLPAKKMQTRQDGSLKGAAIPLHPVGDNGKLLVCEGIETALAAHELFSLPVYACASAWGLKSVDLPNGVTELFIVADNDQNNTGYKAAHQLAVRAIKENKIAHIWRPEHIGHDALDELVYRKESAKGGNHDQ